MATNLLIFGPPGAGKGTQAARLKDRLGLLHISTGDMFREHLRTRSELGLQVEAMLAAGNLVPDALTNAMVEERLSRADAQDGVLLDGFPRNVAQARFLEGLRRIDAVIVLELGAEEILRRLHGRSAKEGRSDDGDADVIENRLRTYRDESEPCIAYYRERGVTIATVNAVGTMEEISERILAALPR